MTTRLDTWQDEWHWDYEESVTNYYHVYNDDGMVCYFEVEQTEENDTLVGTLCDIHNKLLKIAGDENGE